MNSNRVYRPYVATDVETTGLSAVDDQLLSVAMVLDHDPRLPLERLDKIHLKIRPSDGRLVGTLFAANMNKVLIDEIFTGKNLTDDHSALVLDENARGAIFDFLHICNRVVADWDAAHDFKVGQKIQVAGKNASKLDLPFLNAFFTGGFERLVSHRVIDPGSMAYTRFGYIPSMPEVNKLTGRPPVTHNALEDAYDVVSAVRFFSGF